VSLDKNSPTLLKVKDGIQRRHVFSGLVWRSQVVEKQARLEKSVLE
jgi:hypothetical protein